MIVPAEWNLDWRRPESEGFAAISRFKVLCWAITRSITSACRITLYVYSCHGYLLGLTVSSYKMILLLIFKRRLLCLSNDPTTSAFVLGRPKSWTKQFNSVWVITHGCEVSHVEKSGSSYMLGPVSSGWHLLWFWFKCLRFWWPGHWHFITLTFYHSNYSNFVTVLQYQCV